MPFHSYGTIERACASFYILFSHCRALNPRDRGFALGASALRGGLLGRRNAYGPDKT